MPRVSTNVARLKRKNQILAQAKGAPTPLKADEVKK